MRPPEDIEDYFEPGQTLEEELDDEHLARDLDFQRRTLIDLRLRREERAYWEAECEAQALGLDEPTAEMVASYVRWLEKEELDAAPNWPY